LDVPAGTVRWRLKAALDQLRQKLDERYGGESRRWMEMVVPLAGVAPGRLAGVGFGLKAALGAAVVAAVGTAWWAMPTLPKRATPLPLTHAPVAKVAAPPAFVTLPPVEAARAPSIPSL